MKLDVLSLEVAMSRWGGKHARIGVNAKVVPADNDTILIGSTHIFAKHNFRTDVERIEATLWVRSDPDILATAKARFPESLRRDDDLVGWASAFISNKELEPAILSFLLHLDESQMSQLVSQLSDVTPGRVTIDLGIEGLGFCFPDDDIWELHNTDHPTQYLPLKHFDVQIAKLRTTRGAISEATALAANNEMADSDDLGERRLGISWINDASKTAAEQSKDPTLAVLRHCRTLLTLLLICVALLLSRRF